MPFNFQTPLSLSRDSEKRGQRRALSSDTRNKTMQAMFSNDTLGIITLTWFEYSVKYGYHAFSWH